MKKSIKSVLAKSLAVAMAFSLAGITPNTSSEAAAKKPTLTKKVTVTVGEVEHPMAEDLRKRLRRQHGLSIRRAKKLFLLARKKLKA